MPTRFIKDSCRSSRNLDRLSDFEERLFWRMLTTADDHGRFMADLELVRANCFPYKTLSLEKVKEALNGLESHGLITLYTVGDRQYGEFVTFQKHQGAPRSKSRHPEKPIDNNMNELDGSLHAGVSSSLQMQTPRAELASAPNTNTNLNSSSLSSSSLNSPDPEFEQFWIDYPRKVGKKAARRAWGKARDKPPLDAILAALRVQRESEQWQKDGGQYIPHPATWLNEGRWADQLPPKKKSLYQEFAERHQPGGTHGDGLRAVLSGVARAHCTTVGASVPGPKRIN